MQLEFFDVPSPCVSVCQSDEKGLCLGCLRNREERLNWNNFTSDDKQKVIKRCKQRKKRKDNAAQIKSVEINSDETNELPLQPSLLEPPTKPVIDTSTDFDFDDFEL